MIDVPQAGILELFSLAGQRAIVTGGGRGIGRAIAQAFGEASARAILVARSRDQLTRTTAELPNTVAMPADVTSADPDQLIADCERALGGPIDVIVHAAGSQHREPSVRFPLAEWDRLLRVHLTVCDPSGRPLRVRHLPGPPPEHRVGRGRTAPPGGR